MPMAPLVYTLDLDDHIDVKAEYLVTIHPGANNKHHLLSWMRLLYTRQCTLR